jgi:hypothetical protein
MKISSDSILNYAKTQKGQSVKVLDLEVTYNSEGNDTFNFGGPMELFEKHAQKQRVPLPWPQSVSVGIYLGRDYVKSVLDCVPFLETFEVEDFVKKVREEGKAQVLFLEGACKDGFFVFTNTLTGESQNAQHSTVKFEVLISWVESQLSLIESDFGWRG